MTAGIVYAIYSITLPLLYLTINLTSKMMQFNAIKTEALSQAAKLVLLLIVLVFLVLFNNSLMDLRDCLLAFIKMNGYNPKNISLNLNESQYG